VSVSLGLLPSGLSMNTWTLKTMRLSCRPSRREGQGPLRVRARRLGRKGGNGMVF
jgi:hypothetical protein